KQPKRGRLWLADGSCIRLRPEQRNHVWSYDFVEDRTHEGRKYRMLNVLDEFSHECLAIRVARKLKAIDVIDVLRVAGCATPTGSAGHASATASLKLTLHLDHSVGANHGTIDLLDLKADLRSVLNRSHFFKVNIFAGQRQDGVSALNFE